ncbi:hypothetical protein AOLI_G00135650 [Acnodon oligacanthus]
MFKRNSRAKEAMDRWCLLHLVEVFLITPCFCESAALDCPDINATVGQPLNLTCTVRCEGCISTRYKWMKVNKTLKRENSSGQLQFYYPIQNLSMEHNGTYTFWVQLKSGPLTKNFSVILSENKNETNPYYDTLPGDYSHNHKVAVIFVAILSTIALAASIGCI